MLEDQFGGPSDALTDDGQVSDITLSFAEPAQRVGFEVGIGNIGGITTYEVSFFDSGGALLGSVRVTVSHERESHFVGWEEVGGISRINILEITPANFRVGGLTDIRWEEIDAQSLPVSATACMVLLGLAGVVVCKRIALDRHRAGS